MPARMKIRSASVEDLGNIVKHMIDGVLEDNDQVARLRRAVFEEYYSKRMEELKQVKAKIENKIETDNTEKGSIGILEAPVSRDDIGDNICDDSLASPSESHKISREEFNARTPTDSAHSEATVSKLTKSETVLKANEKTAANFLIDEVDPPTVHVIRRQKYVKVVQEADDRVSDICRSNIALESTQCKGTTDLTPNGNDSKTKEHVDIYSEKYASNNVDIIEWRRRTSGKEAAGDNSSSGKKNEISVQFKSRGEIAFENWKKEKSNAYQRIFREEMKRKRIEQTAKARQNEKREAANEAYLYWRRQQDARQKLSNARNRILAQIESQKLQSNEKNRANSQAFRVWKRQKDVKLKERRMYMMAYSGQNHPQQQPKPRKPTPCVDVTFNMWLDQLDCVLHQKYLRERRYLVRSFYCQPAYFGTAALCGR